MRYFLIGNVKTLDVHEEFSTREAAHLRWDYLKESCAPGECNLKLREMQEVTSKRLSQKIFKISREAGAVERKGVAENNCNESKPLYAYPRIEDVLEVVQPLLNKYKLIATGSVVREPVTHVVRGGAATTEMLVEWTLEDSDTGESRTWRIPGSGSDEQGKGSYRALTGSRKYFYVIAFNLKFGDEPEEVQRATDSLKRPVDVAEGS